LFIGVIAMAGIVCVMSAGVIARYVFNSPFDWTEELATVLFIWLSFMGTSVATWQRRHVNVDFIVGMFKPSVAKIARIISIIIVLIFLVFMCIGSFALLPKVLIQRSVALGIPRYVSYLPITICSFYMIFAFFLDLINTIKDPSEAVTKNLNSAA